LKAIVECDVHDIFPQFHFHTEDLKWFIKQAEKAAHFERTLRSIVEDMNGKETSELIEMASMALKD
jgi:hypothetical protein